MVAVGSEADATLIAGTHNQHLGTAHLDVAFANVLRGTRIAARGDGLFKNVRLAQTQAMNTTGGHGTNRDNVYHFESRMTVPRWSQNRKPRWRGGVFRPKGAALATKRLARFSFHALIRSPDCSIRG